MTHKIVFVTFGSEGDLRPMVAIAARVASYGHAVAIAGAEHHREVVERYALDFHPVRPGYETMLTDLGMSVGEFIKALQSERNFVRRRMVLPYLSESYQDICAASEHATTIVTTPLSYAGAMVAERRNLNHVGILLQPLALPSSWDPSILPWAPKLSLAISKLGPVGGRLLIWLDRLGLAECARTLNAFRHSIGLRNTVGHPVFEGQYRRSTVIGLYSPILGRVQRDHPPGMTIAGFPMDQADDGSVMDASLEKFLSHGDPPVLFTLSSSLIRGAEEFIEISFSVARRMGRRAVIVVDSDSRDRWSERASDEIFVSGHTPFDQVFPRCAAIVHHGGIGTTAQAMASGRPQLVVPHYGDQFDNAERIQRVALGRRVAAAAYSERRVSASIESLLNNDRIVRTAAGVASQVRGEIGSEIAARRICGLTATVSTP